MGDLSRLRADLAAALTIEATRGADENAPGSGRRVAAVAARALPADGAAITLMASDAVRHTLAATDEVITAVEQAQHVVGEGPSLDAFTGIRPVLVSDLSASRPQAAWPGLMDWLADLPVRALFAFPMHLGSVVIGGALCYRRTAGELDADDVTFALDATDLLTLAMLNPEFDQPRADDHSAWLGEGIPGSRAVHQATGMAMVQLGGVTAAVAFARLRAHAFASAATLESVAAEIIAGDLILSRDTPGPA